MDKKIESKQVKTKTVTLQTAECRVVDFAGAQAQYDNCAKTILSHKEFLARILKETVSELAGFSVTGIINDCLTEEPEVSVEPVDRDVNVLYGDTEFNAVSNKKSLYLSKEKFVIGKKDIGKEKTDNIPSRIESHNIEDTSVTEGVNYFDLKFNIRIPGDDKEIRLIINLESQKDNESYPMEKRGIYYIGRLISAQKGIIFENDHYEKIRKVYSIWIRSNVTKDMKNTVTVYNLTENDIIGARKAKKEDYDLICMVMIGLGDHEDAQPGTMLKMLDVLFSKQLETKDKKELLEDRCGIPMKEERIEEEVETMCSLGQGIYQEGLEQGMEQGIEQGVEIGGIKTLIQDNIEENIPISRIIEKLMRRFSLSEEAAREKIDFYKNEALAVD